MAKKEIRCSQFGWYIVYYADNNVFYLHKDATWHYGCGLPNYFKTRKEAREFWRKNKTIALSKLLVVLNGTAETDSINRKLANKINEKNLLKSTNCLSDGYYRPIANSVKPILTIAGKLWNKITSFVRN